MKYLQDNKDNSMLIGGKLNSRIYTMHERLCRQVNNPRDNKLIHKMKSRIYNKLRIKMNSIFIVGYFC